MSEHHGMRHTITYARWRAMMRRTSPTSDAAKHYAERGITVCERWRTFKNFLADMGECADAALTLDRIDNAKGYEPGNCRWATVSEQNLNRSSCIVMTMGNITKTATEWARDLGIQPNTLLMRLHLGWSHERALTTPVKRRGKIYRSKSNG